MTLTIKKAPALQNMGNWITGEVKTEDGTTYTFAAKVFDEGSIYGINEGRISKLEIRRDKTFLLNYDRGWDIKPSKEVRPVYKRILAEFN